MRLPPKSIPEPSPVLDEPRSSQSGVFVLDRETGKDFPVLPLSEVILAVISLAQIVSERKFYPYQVQFSYRFIESILLRDGATITAILSRQSGKTEALASSIAAILLIFPLLALKYPNDWRFNLTDKEGRYRGFKQGIKVGIYAPKLSQSEIMYERVKMFLATKSAERVLREQHLTIEVSNGDTLRVSHGSRLLCQTASDTAKIEGETHNLLVLEEAQDISETKIKKSLSPMVAATKGSTVMIGTASTKKCVFYTAIKHNERSQLAGGPRNHFAYNWKICARYNSLYFDYVMQEQVKLGPSSDEFRLSYEIEWLFERGMFVSQELLLNPGMALCRGEIFSEIVSPEFRIPEEFSLVIGIDWGRDHDSTVVSVLAVNWMHPVHTISSSNEHGNYNVQLFQKHLLSWKEWHGDNYELQYNEILQFIRRWGAKVKRVVTDAGGCGAPIYDRLVATLSQTNIEVVPFVFSAQSKSDMYKALYAEICGGRVTFPAAVAARKTTEFRKFTNQMLDLTKTYKEGKMSVSHPDEKHAHDDYPDSFALATWGTLHRPVDAEVDFQDVNIFFRR